MQSTDNSLNWFKVTDSPLTLGETPIWCEQNRCFYFVDIKEGEVYSYFPQNKFLKKFTVPKYTSACLLTEDKDLCLLTAKDGLYLLNVITGTVSLFCPYNLKGLRPNEAQIDNNGNLYLSVMDNEARKEAGALFFFDIKLKRLEFIAKDITVPNTLLFIDDATYFFDSFRPCLYRYVRKTGHLSEVATKLSGIPDGSCLLADDSFLNANWQDNCLNHFVISSNGLELIGSVPLPLRQPSSVALGGEDLNVLFITSASDGFKDLSGQAGMCLMGRSAFKGKKFNRFSFGEK